MAPAPTRIRALDLMGSPLAVSTEKVQRLFEVLCEKLEAGETTAKPGAA